MSGPLHYAYRPSVSMDATMFTKPCSKCGAEFQTQSRVKKRCEACQRERVAALQAREAAKRKARL